MAISTGQSVIITRSTQVAGGALTNADSLPTVTLKRNGAATAETVTVANVSTGEYTLAFTIPAAWSRGDQVELFMRATVATVAGGAVVWSRELEAASGVVVGALVATKQPGNRAASPVTLEAFMHEDKLFSLVVLDAAGVAVDLSGLTMRFVVQNTDSPTTPLFKVDAAGIAVSGASNNVAGVQTAGADNAVSTGQHRWRLWDLTNNQVLVHGPYVILESVQDTP